MKLLAVLATAFGLLAGGAILWPHLSQLRDYMLFGNSIHPLVWRGLCIGIGICGNVVCVGIALYGKDELPETVDTSSKGY